MMQELMMENQAKEIAAAAAEKAAVKQAALDSTSSNMVDTIAKNGENCGDKDNKKHQQHLEQKEDINTLPKANNTGQSTSTCNCKVEYEKSLQAISVQVAMLFDQMRTVAKNIDCNGDALDSGTIDLQKMFHGRIEQKDILSAGDILNGASFVL